jgi:hypothetical protein
MTTAFTSLLKIERGEGAKVFQFALLAAVLQAGLAVGTGAADSLFLRHVGPARLPVVYLLTPVMMLLYIPVYAYLTGRLGMGRLLRLTIGLLTCGGFAVAALLTLGPGSNAPWIFYGAKLYTGLWFVAQYSVFWNFTDDYFDILDSKRLFPLLSSGSAIGAMAGGALLSALSDRLPTPALFGVWAVVAGTSLPVALMIQRRYRTVAAGAEPDGEPRLPEVFGTISSAMRRSGHVRLLVAIGFICFMTAALCEFQYMTLFSQGRDEADLTALFGRLFVFVNAFSLVFGLLCFNRLVLRIGVPNMALVQPGAFLLAFVFLLLTPGFPAALLGFFVYQGLMPAVTYDTHNLLLNAAPPDLKSYVRTFVDGLAEPGAVAASGLFLLLGAAALGAERISVVGVCVAGAYLSVVLFMRAGYAAAMAKNLRRGWLNLADPAEHLLRRLPPEDLDVLEAAAASQDPRDVRTAIRILWLNDKQAATKALLASVGRAQQGDREALRPLVARVLDASDPELAGLVIEWARARSAAELGPMLIEELGARGLARTEVLTSFAQSASADERAAAAVGLLNSRRLEEGAQGARLVRDLLREPGGTAAGVRALGLSGRPQYAYAVAPFARHASLEVRNEAVRALLRLMSPEHHLLSAEVLATIRDGTTDERIGAMETLARIGDPASIPPLLRIGDAFTPLERRRAEAAILQFGLQSVPVLVSVLRDRTCPFKGRAVAARALGRLALPQLTLLSTPLIRDEIAQAYRGVWRWSLLEREPSTPGMEALKRYYLDVRRDVVDFVLEVLAIGGRLPSFELLSASLASENRKERGDAIETIEQGLTRDLFHELLPLIDQRSPAAQAAYYQRRHSPEAMPAMQVLGGALCGTRLERLIAAQALCDAGPAGVSLLREQLETLDPEVAGEVFGAITRDGTGDTALTQVEKIHHLHQSSLFAQLGIQEAHAVARRADARRLVNGETVFRRGDPADAIFCVLDGSVELRGGSHSEVRLAREVFGEAALRGESRRATQAVSLGALVLVVPCLPLLQEARNDARIAALVCRNALEPHSA